MPPSYRIAAHPVTNGADRTDTEEAVVRAAPWILRILPAVESGAGAAAVGSEAIMLAPVFIPGDSAQPLWAQRYTDKAGKIAKEIGKKLGRRIKPEQIEKAIHEAKKALDRGDAIRNPDVEVNVDTGDIRPKTPNGGLGDSIGNIEDYL